MHQCGRNVKIKFLYRSLSVEMPPSRSPLWAAGGVACIVRGGEERTSSGSKRGAMRVGWFAALSLVVAVVLPAIERVHSASNSTFVDVAP